MQPSQTLGKVRKSYLLFFSPIFFNISFILTVEYLSTFFTVAVRYTIFYQLPITVYINKMLPVFFNIFFIYFLSVYIFYRKIHIFLININGIHHSRAMFLLMKNIFWNKLPTFACSILIGDILIGIIIYSTYILNLTSLIWICKLT